MDKQTILVLIECSLIILALFVLYRTGYELAESTRRQEDILEEIKTHLKNNEKQKKIK